MDSTRHVMGAFPLPILKECDVSGYLFRIIQIERQASKPHDGQQLRLFHGRHDIRQGGNGTLGHADDRRVVLRPPPVGGCRRTAAAPIQMYRQRRKGNGARPSTLPLAPR